MASSSRGTSQASPANASASSRFCRSRSRRAAVADAQQRARLGLAALFHDLDPTLDEKTAWRVGSFYLALLPGVVAQWLIDPEHAPSARDLAEALHTIAVDVGGH
jgi:hypothetical protein